MTYYRTNDERNETQTKATGFLLFFLKFPFQQTFSDINTIESDLFLKTFNVELVSIRYYVTVRRRLTYFGNPTTCVFVQEISNLSVLKLGVMVY